MFITQSYAAVFSLNRRKHELCQTQKASLMFMNTTLMVHAKITHEHLRDLKDFIKQTLPEKSVKNTE